MASTSGSLEMSLRRFDSSNFNFWKEQMQDYLIVKGKIDPIETENPLEGYKLNEWQNLVRIVHATIQMHFVGGSVLHNAIVLDNLRTLEDTVGHL